MQNSCMPSADTIEKKEKNDDAESNVIVQQRILYKYTAICSVCQFAPGRKYPPVLGSVLAFLHNFCGKRRVRGPFPPVSRRFPRQYCKK